MNEAKRLYTCIRHDFADDKDREDMWTRELQLVINRKVLEAIAEVKQQRRVYFKRIEGNDERISLLNEPPLVFTTDYSFKVDMEAIEQIEKRHRDEQTTK